MLSLHYVLAILELGMLMDVPPPVDDFRLHLARGVIELRGRDLSVGGDGAKQGAHSEAGWNHPLHNWFPVRCGTINGEAQGTATYGRSEEHTSELQVTNAHLVCRLMLEKK